MKKIFTLATLALLAAGANAQTQLETNWDWQAVDADGNISADLGNETDGWKKNVTIQKDNYSIYLLNNSDPDTTTVPNLTSDNWDHFKPCKWNTQNIMLDTYDATNTNVGKKFYAVCGTGVPAVKFIGGQQTKDGEVVTDDNGNVVWFVPQAESDGTTAGYVYYKPDGSMGAPTVGPFMTLKATVAGQFKVGFWANKGGNRALYIVDRSTGKALNPWGENPEYHAEGWVQNYRVKNTLDGSQDESLVYVNPMPIDSSYVIATDDSNKDKFFNFNVVGQRKCGYLIFNAEPGKEYTIVANNWQIGLSGVKFTVNTAGINSIAANKFDANAPIYNLAGQRVSKSFRGVVIQNGRKFLQ